jgi:hypothetical protein
MNIKDIKTVEIEDIKDNDKIYIMPGSLSKSVPQGNINVPVVGLNGKELNVPVPRTWIPFKLTEFAPASAFTSSLAFRKYIVRAFIRIVDSSDAEEFLKTDSNAHRELIRIRDDMSFIEHVKDEIPITEKIEEVINQEPNINYALVDILTNPDTSDEDKLTVVISEHMLKTFTNEDFNYVRSNTDSKLILDWANTTELETDNKSEDDTYTTG